MKQRAMRIEAGLPAYLWPWITMTAGYLMNRTPLENYNWKTPFELATGKKPNLAHLVQFGAKAYPIDKHIPKREKSRAKAHIGFLVGYDSTNIYLIWIPSQHKVIRTRDVTFNEDLRYLPHEIDAAQLVSEPFLLDDTLDIPWGDFTRLTEIESDSDEEEFFELAPTGSVVTNKEPIDAEADVPGYLPSPSASSRGDTPQATPLPSSPESFSPETRPALPSGQPQSIDTTPLEHSPPPSASIPKPKHWQKTTLDESNVLPEGSKRTRKPNPRHEAYFNALDGAQAGMQAFNNAFIAALVKEKRPHRDNLLPEPKNYKQMLKHPESTGFLRAMNTEVSDLQKKGTWKVVSSTAAKEVGKTAIPTTWVYKYKFDNDGHLLKHKARLCARGDLQQTTQDVYAATLAIRIFRALMAIVTAFGMSTRQYDAVNAFANSDIDEPTFCKTPEGWNGQSGMLLQLLKALYGLKQSPSLWYKHLSATLIELGLEPVSGIECLFTNDYMLVFFYVDDIAVLYYPRYIKQVDAFEKRLFAAYEMRNLGELEWFLGIRITRDREQQTMSLCQDSYIDKLTSKFNITTTAKAPGLSLSSYLPMQKHEETATPQLIYTYQQLVGSINFAAVTTRPDIAFSASKLAEFLRNPSSYHTEQAYRVLRYLHHTKNYAIVFNGQADKPEHVFLDSSDASFADDVDTRQSSNGYCFKLFNGLIDWKASKQKTVTTSSTEAELLAMSITANTKMWWDRFFQELQLNVGGITYIECDNRQTIRAFSKPGAQLTTKLRHVDIHRHWLRQEVQKGTIHIEWTATTKILADGLTKMLPPQRHQEFIKLIGLEPIDLAGKEEKAPKLNAYEDVNSALNAALNND